MSTLVFCFFNYGADRYPQHTNIVKPALKWNYEASRFCFFESQDRGVVKSCRLKNCPVYDSCRYSRTWTGVRGVGRGPAKPTTANFSSRTIWKLLPEPKNDKYLTNQSVFLSLKDVKFYLNWKVATSCLALASRRIMHNFPLNCTIFNLEVNRRPLFCAKA